MHLTHLTLINFKNYRHSSFDFSGGINCITGDNGAGKTNLLDAIHYLSFCKSYFNSFDNQNIYFDEDMFVLQGLFDFGEKKEEIYCAQKRNERKQFMRNKKEYNRLSEHIGLIPLVMISPTDNALIIDGSDVRRKFIDTIISQTSKGYLEALIEYNKALMNRNALLKHFHDSNQWDDALLEPWNKLIIFHGERIYNSRRAFFALFSVIFRDTYFEITGAGEEATVSYSCILSENDFYTLLLQNTEKDRAFSYTTSGVHKDDLIFCIKDKNIKKFASQGQQKSFTIALKIAQFRYLKQYFNYPPILLMDDIFDKLDEYRVNGLFNLICSDQFDQVFITHVESERLLKMVDSRNKEYKMFPIMMENVTEHITYNS